MDGTVLVIGLTVGASPDSDNCLERSNAAGEAAFQHAYGSGARIYGIDLQLRSFRGANSFGRMFDARRCEDATYTIAEDAILEHRLEQYTVMKPHSFILITFHGAVSTKRGAALGSDTKINHHYFLNKLEVGGRYVIQVDDEYPDENNTEHVEHQII